MKIRIFPFHSLYVAYKTAGMAPLSKKLKNDFEFFFNERFFEKF